MATNNTLYDKCNNQMYNEQYTKYNNLMFDNIYAKSCYNDNPQIISQRNLTHQYQGVIDIESDLFNINKPINRCDNYNNLSLQQQNKDTSFNFMKCDFPVENTRLTNNASNIREVGYNRFNILCEDVQLNVIFPGREQIQTRQLFRDNHRPCLTIPLNSTNIVQQQGKLK